MRYVFMLVLLAGCAQKHWTSATRSSDDFHRDVFYCDQAVDHISQPLVRSDRWENCLRARGWREVD